MPLFTNIRQLERYDVPHHEAFGSFWIHAEASPHLYEEEWLEDYCQAVAASGKKRNLHDYRDAYLFGIRSSHQNHEPYSIVKESLEEVWNDLIGPDKLEWEEAQPVIEYAYTHSC